MTTQTRMTEEQFMRLPDDGRKYELVDGEAIVVILWTDYLLQTSPVCV